MKIVVLGDFSQDGHFGCKLVSKAILENLTKRGHEVLRVVPCMKHWRYYEEDLKNCDLVVVNGEGSIHHGRGMALLEVASEYPSVLINAVYQDVPENEHLKRFLYVSVRESRSAKEMEKHGVTPEIVPDVIFSQDVPRGTPTKDLCVVGSVNNQRNPPKEVMLDAYDPDFIEKMSEYKRVVTGRFHGVCLAMMWGMPFTAYPSNTHKIIGMLEDIGSLMAWYHHDLEMAILQDKIDARPGKPSTPIPGYEVLEVDCSNIRTRFDCANEYVAQARQKIQAMFDHISSIQPVKFDAPLNTPDSQILENIRLSGLRDLQELEQLPPRNDKIAVVGGGPSLKNEIEMLKAFPGVIVSTNNTHDYLLRKGIKPNFYVMSDAKPENAKYVQNPNKGTTYLISSKCHPSVFDALKDETVIKWHEWLNIGEDESVLRICGGSTVGLKSLNVMYILGFRDFHLFGMDSCLTDDEHHAYKQPVNDRDSDNFVEITCGDKKFKCAPWMAKQADDFRDFLGSLGHLFKIKIYGGGLLSQIMDEAYRLSTKRYGAINDS